MYDAWFSRPSPLAIIATTTPPTTASSALPLPPNRLVPPMTAAPTAYNNTLPAPEDADTFPPYEAAMMPLSAASDEHTTNADSLIRST